MDPIIRFLDIDTIFFTIMGYSMSYLEFFGTLFGGIAVALSARAIVWHWWVGMVNVVLFFFLFYQVQLYPDMFLQMFYLVTNMIGWWRWTHPRAEEADEHQELRISRIGRREWLFIVVAGTVGTLVSGYMASHIHTWLPAFFPLPGAFPYSDSFVTVMSMMTTFLVIRKKVEAWLFWIVIDAAAAGIYFLKGIRFVAFEYAVFCVIASFGWWYWYRTYRSYALSATHKKSTL